MQKFFASLYSSLVSIFLNQKPADYGLYKTQAFGLVGWSTLGAALALVLVFYYLFNSAFRSNLYRPVHWALVLLGAAGLGAWLAYGLSVQQGIVPSKYLGYFMIANALLAVVWFVVLSILLKRKSTYAWTTPIAWPTFAR